MVWNKDLAILQNLTNLNDLVEYFVNSLFNWKLVDDQIDLNNFFQHNLLIFNLFLPYERKE